MADDPHQAFEADFSDHYEGGLTPERRRAVDDHLASCERCRAEYARFREAVEAVSGLGRAAAPKDFSGRVADTIHRRSAGRFFGRRALGDRVPFELIAGIALVALLVAYLVLIRWKI